MTDPHLWSKILPVDSRIRTIRVWCGLAVIFFVVALLGAWLLWQKMTTGVYWPLASIAALTLAVMMSAAPNRPDNRPKFCRISRVSRRSVLVVQEVTAALATSVPYYFTMDPFAMPHEPTWQTLGGARDYESLWTTVDTRRFKVSSLRTGMCNDGVAPVAAASSP